MLLRRDRWEGSLAKGDEHRISSATDVDAAIAALDGWTRTQVSLVVDDGTVLAVGGGADDFLVQFLLREDGGEWLVIGSDKDGEADLAIGRQQAPYPRRTLTMPPRQRRPPRTSYPPGSVIRRCAASEAGDPARPDDVPPTGAGGCG